VMDAEVHKLGETGVRSTASTPMPPADDVATFIDFIQGETELMEGMLRARDLGPVCLSLFRLASNGPEEPPRPGPGLPPRCRL
jgi:hypothetical protein